MWLDVSLKECLVLTTFYFIHQQLVTILGMLKNPTCL